MPERSSRGSRLVAGLISGTSMDGIDAALVRISGPATKPRVRLLAFETTRYPEWLRARLLAVAGGAPTTAEEIDQLHHVLGAAFAEAVLRVSRRAHVSPSRLFAIGSHGQTIHHFGGTNHAANLKSRSAMGVPCTLQIAEAAIIAERTGAPVVADFRTADMAAGGQGAPLVPMVDYLLLRDARKGVVALNIGGIANFTVIPAGATPDQVFGFDTGPGNMLIDGLVRRFTEGRKTYDAGGRWAARGEVLEPLLEELLRDPFFALRPPKSAGREQFGDAFLARFFPQSNARIVGGSPANVAIENRQSAIGNSRQSAIGNLAGDSPAHEAIENRQSQIGNSEGLLRTATELTARTVAGALERFVLKKIPVHRLVVSGGGAHNGLLMARLAELLPALSVHPSDEFGLDVDAKEAIAFAVLADRTMHGLAGNLPAVTGARRPVVLGKISRP